MRAILTCVCAVILSLGLVLAGCTGRTKGKNESLPEKPQQAQATDNPHNMQIRIPVPDAGSRANDAANLIREYIKTGQLEEARKIYDSMSELGDSATVAQARGVAAGFIKQLEEKGHP